VTKKEEKIRVIELNKDLIQFIKETFLSPPKINGIEVKQNDYAKACDLSNSTFTKINDSSKNYNIPLSTIFSITELEKIPLDKFFKEFLKYRSNKNIEQ